MLAATPGQRKAIEMLTSGHTLVESATAAGVGTDDVVPVAEGGMRNFAWRRTTPGSRMRWGRARGRLLAMSDLAVTTVGKAMKRGDAKTGAAVLKSKAGGDGSDRAGAD